MGQRLRFQWSNAAQCERASRDVIRRFKTVTDAAKERLIHIMAAALEVELPERAPKEYKAMGWDEVRACARNGVTFGPHTVTHPILSQVDYRRAREEITASWQVVREATDAAVPVFCYPNGGPADFSARDKAFVAEAGMKAAVSGVGGCVELDRVTDGSTDRFSLPRFPYSEHKPRFVQIASGIEAMKTRMRKPFALR